MMRATEWRGAGRGALVAAAVGLLCGGWSGAGEAGAGAEAQARAILEAAGVRGGLVVHLGCGDGKLTAALRASESYLVHGLDADAMAVEKARAHVHALGLYGPVSIDRLRGTRLPYVDNLAALVVAEDLPSTHVALGEVMRVLRPEGVAYVRSGGGWRRHVKPRPTDIDEWTHFLHDASNNAVSHDLVVGPPRRMQWVGGPRWARSHDHLSSVSAVVSSGGRLFAIVDEGPIATVALPPKWVLVARDAFSGVVLWKRPIERWEPHLRGFRSGPSAIARRLVAVGDTVYVTLGYDEPVTALDAATGERIRTYEGTEGTLEILHHERVLTVVAGIPDKVEDAKPPKKPMGTWLFWEVRETRHPRKRLLAIEADTGKVLWSKADADTSELMPTAVAAADGRVFFQNAREIVCLDSRSGSVRWRAARRASGNRPAWSAPTLVVHKGVVLSADRSATAKTAQKLPASERVRWIITSVGGVAPVGELVAFAADTGKRLWSCPSRECYNAPVDVLVAGGLVWTGNLVRANEPGVTVGRDPLTGTPKKQRPPDKESFRVGMSHHRCYRNKATDRYLVLGRAGVEMIDVATGKADASHWVRGACQYGVVPCNGLIYAPPHSCACYIHAKLNGFNALAGEGRGSGAESRGKEGGRLERGPAFGQPLDPRPPTPDPSSAWPTLRHDPARSGSTAAAIPAELRTAWQTDVGGRVTSVVVAGGRVFLASVDTHTVHALDAAGGRRLWSTTVGGRVDSPPTVYRGLVLFGCTDGHVYALRASDGALAWRFRAAPTDRRVVAYGQLESVWPVHGSVLVYEPSPGKPVLACAAGRSSFLDGGIAVCRLDPRTGTLLSETRVADHDAKTGLEPQETIRGTDMTSGVLPDVLSTDGASLYLRQVRFDLDGKRQAQGAVHLFSSAGYLDGDWWHRTYWILGSRFPSGWGSWPNLGNRVPAGRLLVADATDIYGYGRNRYHRDGSHWGLSGTGYRLFGAGRTPKKLAAPAPAKKKARRGGPRVAVDVHWSREIPVVARALVLAGKTLFVAGPPDTGKPDEALAAALGGRKGGLLWAVGTADGKQLGEVKLASPPVFDGMAAAGGRLYLATLDGKVVCLAGSK